MNKPLEEQYEKTRKDKGYIGCFKCKRSYMVTLRKVNINVPGRTKVLKVYVCKSCLDSGS